MASRALSNLLGEQFSYDSSTSTMTSVCLLALVALLPSENSFGSRAYCSETNQNSFSKPPASEPDYLSVV